MCMCMCMCVKIISRNAISHKSFIDIAMIRRFLLLLALPAEALHAHSALAARTTTPVMGARKRNYRFEDAEDKRISQGGSGGGIGRPNRFGLPGAYTNTESRRFGSADPGQEIRRKKLEAYLDNDLEPTDGTFGRVLAGTMLVIIFSLLFGVVQYYGGIEGLASITEKQRSIRGI